jgi:hypothetical protein
MQRADEEIMLHSAGKAIALLLVLPVNFAMAGGPPKLDVTASCNSAARVAIAEGRNKRVCLEDESTAEATLTKDWEKFNAVDRVQCVGNVNTGGPTSYVELLSCLEVMRDAKKILEAEKGTPPDLRPPPDRRRR